MSEIKENVIWKSRNGEWSRGFFSYKEGQVEDYERDLKYDMSSFSWASTGHASETNARAAWQGVDPKGTHTFLVACEETDKFDKMALFCLDLAQSKKKVSLG